MSDRNLEIENRIALESETPATDVRTLGPDSFYTCPECHGSMVAIEEGPIRRFRCHTGHGFTAACLYERAVTEIERTLWAALAQLEEHGILLRELEQRARTGADPDAAARHGADAAQTGRVARQVKALLLGHMFSTAPPTVVAKAAVSPAAGGSKHLPRRRPGLDPPGPGAGRP